MFHFHKAHNHCVRAHQTKPMDNSLIWNLTTESVQNRIHNLRQTAANLDIEKQELIIQMNESPEETFASLDSVLQNSGGRSAKRWRMLRFWD